MASALCWHYNLTSVCVGNMPVEPLHFPFFLQQSLGSFLIIHCYCLDWMRWSFVLESQFLKEWQSRLHKSLKMGSFLLTCEVWFYMSIGHATTLLPIFPSSLFLSPFTMTLLIASACQFPWGYAGVEYLLVIPRSQQYLLKDLLLNWRPLSEMRVWGTPNSVTIFFQTNFLASTSLIFAKGSTSTHLVK